MQIYPIDSPGIDYYYFPPFLSPTHIQKKKNIDMDIIQ